MKMKTENNIDNCLFGNELVSYLYGEMSAAARPDFEDHLRECNSCIAEFAGVSEARLGVFEWHRDEFLALETPRIVIPYAQPSAPVYSWIDALRDLVLSPAKLATAGALLAVLGFGFAFFYSGSEERSVAVNGVISVDPVAVDEATTVSKVDPLHKGGVVNILPIKQLEQTAKSKVVQVKLPKSKLPIRSQQPLTANVPRLGNFDDVTDTSLRLADLVADIDTDED